MQRGLNWIVYLKARGFLELLGALPRPAAYWLAETLAGFVHRVDRKHRNIGMTNLRIAFPESDFKWRSRVVRESYLRLGHQAIELSRLPRLTAEEAAERVPYEEGRGLANYLEAKKDNRGVLFLTAHISAWELLPAAHALRGHPLSFVVRPLENPYLEKWATGLRSKAGNRVIPKQAATRRILTLLQQKQDIGLLIDQNVQSREGVFVPFLGTNAWTTPSLASLALRTGAPVVPGFIYPQAKTGYYRIRFYPPLRLQPSGRHERDLHEHTALFNRYIEEMIREFPGCWLWGHRRFRSEDHDPY
jgi:Kdo2-lipid IVA lauroyltransferase/acyltransferase